MCDDDSAANAIRTNEMAMVQKGQWSASGVERDSKLLDLEEMRATDEKESGTQSAVEAKKPRVTSCK